MANVETRDKRDKRLRITDDEVIEAPINPKYIRRLFQYAKPYKSKIVLSVIVMLLASVANLASPLIMQMALDDCIVPQNFTMLPWLALAYRVQYSGGPVRALEDQAHGHHRPEDAGHPPGGSLQPHPGAGL